MARQKADGKQQGGKPVLKTPGRGSFDGRHDMRVAVGARSTAAMHDDKDPRGEWMTGGCPKERQLDRWMDARGVCCLPVCCRAASDEVVS